MASALNLIDFCPLGSLLIIHRRANGRVSGRALSPLTTHITISKKRSLRRCLACLPACPVHNQCHKHTLLYQSTARQSTTSRDLHRHRRLRPRPFSQPTATIRGRNGGGGGGVNSLFPSFLPCCLACHVDFSFGRSSLVRPSRPQAPC